MVAGDAGNKLRAVADRSPEPWEAWGRLRETVMSGQSGFVRAYGRSTYAYLVRHPELAAPSTRKFITRSM